MPKLLGRFRVEENFHFNYNGKARYGHAVADQSGKNIADGNIRFWVHTAPFIDAAGYRSLDPSKIEITTPPNGWDKV